MKSIARIHLLLLLNLLLLFAVSPAVVAATCSLPLQDPALSSGIPPEKQFEVGRQLLAAGNVRGALGIARQMLKDDADPAATERGRRAIALLVAAEAQAGNLSQSMPLLDRLEQARKHPGAADSAAIMPLLALVELRAGELQKAQALLKGAIDALPENAHLDKASVALTLARAPVDAASRASAVSMALQSAKAAIGSSYRNSLVISALEIAAEISDPGDFGSILRELDSLESDSLNEDQLAVILHARLLLAMRGGQDLAVKRAGASLENALTRFKGTINPEWWWTRGKSLIRTGEPARALLAYQLAVAEAGAQRQALDFALLNSGSSFQLRFSPLFEEYAALLLPKDQKAEFLGSDQLKQAIDVAELSRLADITGLMRDPCLVADTTRIASVDEPSSAVLYPFLFEDRVELLLLTREGVSRSTVTVTKTEVQTRVGRWLAQLQQPATRLYLPTARSLHEILVAPVIPELRRKGLKHLVLVPDGLLRTIPFAALHDGNRFLVEEFSLAVVPGLKLSQRQPMKKVGFKTLAVGLSEARQGFEALPAVEQELGFVAKALQCTPVLNNSFTTQRLRNDLSGSRATIVHVASHAEFSPDPRATFLLTYDGKLRLEDIRDSLLTSARQRAPLDLLVLSACQTAVGDERAALGLAGMALRTGARSAVASLWQVSDDSTNKLIQRFYVALMAEGQGRAESLRLAQLDVLKTEEFAHPAFWAPFILVGSWM